MKTFCACLVLAALALTPPAGHAADPLFSGPQIGEKTTPFKVLEVTGANPGKERDPVRENAGAPTALVFISAIERSLVPLLRVVDQYGAERTNRLKTEVVFLFADRVAGEERVKAAAGSLKLRSRVGLSLDGAEGPGNYGLNKECMMTILAAKENTVTANFALVQPGIVDAPKVLAALAKVCGDTNPPTVEQLSERQVTRAGERMGRDGSRTERSRVPPVDFTKFDLNSDAGLRDAVRALMTEVQSLRTELAGLRTNSTMERPPAGATERTKAPKEDFPGAVPDDPKLNALLRQIIRPTNDDETVGRLFKDIEAHIEGNAELTRQASNGWVRVLHFGDHYGTPYSRKAGQAFLDKLKSAAPPPK